MNGTTLPRTGVESPLTRALDACRHDLFGQAGRLSFYVRGAGAPLLLVHSINAAGSSYEVKPIFDRLIDSRRAYAIDLPGFGFSDRSKRNYTPRLYTDAIHDMLDLIAKDGNGDQPVDALAISLGSEFVARAALERPGRFRTLTLVTPTGFSKAYGHLSGSPEETREVPGLHRFFTFPLWSQGIFSLLVSKPSIRYFLRRTFGSNNFDERLVDYDYLTTHQPGAKNAPFAFVSGRLFLKDIRAIYERLQLPVWMPHGTKGDFGDVSEAGWVLTRPNWTVTPYDTGALPHFEMPDEFVRNYASFLANGFAPLARSA